MAVYASPAEFAERHLVVESRNGVEWNVRCPIHGERHASLRLNIEKGLFLCHGCGAKGGMARLAKALGVPYRYDKTQAGMFMLLNKLEKLRKGTKEEPPAFLPESTLDRYAIPTRYWTDPIRTGGRGLNAETVEAFDLGYDPINDYVTIPIRNLYGNLIGVTKRYLDPDAHPRYKDPAGFQKGQNLFGSWFAAESDSPTVVLTEGPIDAIKVWQAGHVGMGVYGSRITEHQIMIMRRMGVVSTVLFFDNDKAGEKAFRQAKGWTQHEGTQEWTYTPETDLRRFFVVKRAEYTGVRGKDPASLTDAQVDKAIINARRILR